MTPQLPTFQITPRHKNLIYPAGHGYSWRNNPLPQYGIVLHSTNGKLNGHFSNENNFLYTSPKVSAHYLISKSGIIVEHLPFRYCAWHAGNTNNVHYSNNNSIGIECHFTPGEDKNMPALAAATRWLLEYLCATYHIYGVAMHRAVELPKGRKIDPSHLNDSEFALLVHDLATC